MSDIKLQNIPPMSVGGAVTALSELYTSAIRAGLPLRTLPSVMLWGPPGVGKSQAIRQMADAITAGTGKRTVVTDVRLLLFNPIDLRGIPTANADKTLAVWLKPKIFQMDEGRDLVNILFLDEISAAPQSVQAAAYQITLDRVVGEHRLPENCIVVAAGNRTTDKSVAFKMPKALANRLMHLEIEGSFSSWRSWAVSHGIHRMVLGFLSFRQSYLMGFDSGNEDLAFPTPRSWEMVSNLLHAAGEDTEKLYPLIAGLVGSGAAIEFRTWARIYADLPRIEDIFDEKMPPLPGNSDAMYALAASITAYAREHRHETARLASSIRYIDRMPPDFSALVMRDYMCFEPDFKHKLMAIPEFSRWLQTKGKLLNGAQ